MSYQVLARKWRPKRFQEMVGQEHVLKALVNALDDDRLHHAYLFTGTRGVGKTSIARLFAKSLNCETGVSSDPCGQCGACREIAEGRFVDLIEVDAASRTKVEDTRELLENVQYAPTHGRYKVYLIDEVHMLSTHSFNALLKTLEEPPPHVKFLLATTDPQKLPVTILSRCLQFNLKNLIPERIVEHLRFVLGEEQIPCEDAALWLLARSADGSMRDALSLTDQAIAFGAGQVTGPDVQTMLGTIDQLLVSRLVECLAARDARALLAAVAELAQFSPDYISVLGDMIGLLHRVAIAQVLPDAAENSLGDREQILALAAGLSAEDVQLYYQIALMGRRDLPYVPDAREGLEMVLLRMLAFRPADAAPTADAPLSSAATAVMPAPAAPPVKAVGIAPADTEAAVPRPAVPVSAPAQSRSALAPAVAVTAEAGASDAPAASVAAVLSRVDARRPDAAPPWVVESDTVNPDPPQARLMQSDSAGPPEYDESDIPSGGDSDQQYDLPAGEAPAEKKPERVIAQPLSAAFAAPEQPVSVARPPVTQAAGAAAVPQKSPVSSAQTSATGGQAQNKALMPSADRLSLPTLTAQDWILLCGSLGLGGMTESLVVNLSLESVEGTRFVFHYTPQQQALLNEIQRERITRALCDYFDTTLEVEFESAAQVRETPHQFIQRQRELRQAKAVEAIEQDPLVQDILKQFDAHIDIDSVLPVDPN